MLTVAAIKLLLLLLLLLSVIQVGLAFFFFHTSSTNARTRFSTFAFLLVIVVAVIVVIIMNLGFFFLGSSRAQFDSNHSNILIGSIIVAIPILGFSASVGQKWRNFKWQGLNIIIR